MAQPGVAGPFAGVSGNALVIAGGSNFPDKKPWEGGKKAYVDEVYILEKGRGRSSGNGGAVGIDRVDRADYHWDRANVFRLPQKVAYGASVTTPQGIVCMGGETSGGYSKKVFLLQWDSSAKRLRTRELPDLPAGLANAGAALIGHTVYLAGGEDATRALAGFYCLDMDHPTHWQTLADLPIAISHAAVAAQGGMLYVIGGRSKTASGISTLHHDVYRYDPRERIWRRMHSIGDGFHPPHFSAGNAVAGDHGDILVIGGDDGRIFHQLETLNAELAVTRDDAARKALQRRKMALIDGHPGFWRGVLRYDPVRDRWSQLGDLPVAAPVTTIAVRWEDAVVIPCGEVRPGIRSADILMADISALETPVEAVPLKSSSHP